MFANVLKFYLRCLLVGFGVSFSAFSFADSQGQCHENSAAASAACSAFYLANGASIYDSGCLVDSSAGYWYLNIYQSNTNGVIAYRRSNPNSNVYDLIGIVDWPYSCNCPSGVFVDGVCVDDEPLECPYAGAIPHESGEGCYCPGDQIEGLKNIGGTLQPSCIDPFPPEDEDPDDPEQPCPAGSHPVQFGDAFFCWEEPEPNPCPEGSFPYTQDGVDQCWTPDENSGDCPEGYYKVGYGGQELCLMPTPNIDDPDNPGPGPGPGPGDVNVNVQVDFDDSRIVSRLDQTNAKLDQIGTKLDHGNSKLDSIDETLGDLKDALDGPAQPMPGHSQASAQTFGEANANFLARVNSSALVGAMNSIKNLISVSSSECPSLEFDLNGPIDVSVDSDFHCTMWAQYVAPVLSIIMYVLYIWVAFRVFGSA